jgi:hypothetical protein
MSIDPISGVTMPVRVTSVKRVTRRAKSEAAEAPRDDAPVRAKRSNPPGVGENLDVTV